MWKAFAWEGGDWSARTHRNLTVGRSFMYLFIPRMCVKCPSCVCHRHRQTSEGRSLVKRTLYIEDDLGPVSGTVTLLDCPLR